MNIENIKTVSVTGKEKVENNEDEVLRTLRGNVGIINARTFLNYQNNNLGLKKQFNSYGPVYAFATEDIGKSLSSYKESDRILTVLSSGDHVFNYLLKGAIDIETFDINKVTKYYFGLKKASLSKFSYDEFLELQNNKEEGYLFNLLKKLDELAKYLDKDTYLFWKYYTQNASLTNISNATINSKGLFSNKYNLYFERKNYEKLQTILRSGVGFTFHHSDVTDLHTRINGKFSEMHFSNLFSYFGSRTQIVSNTIYNLSSFLKPGGKMLFYSIGDNTHFNEDIPIEKEEINERDLILTYRK